MLLFQECDRLGIPTAVIEAVIARRRHVTRQAIREHLVASSDPHKEASRRGIYMSYAM